MGGGMDDPRTFDRAVDALEKAMKGSHGQLEHLLKRALEQDFVNPLTEQLAPLVQQVTVLDSSFQKLKRDHDEVKASLAKLQQSADSGESKFSVENYKNMRLAYKALRNDGLSRLRNTSRARNPVDFGLCERAMDDWLLELMDKGMPANVLRNILNIKNFSSYLPRANKQNIAERYGWTSIEEHCDDELF